MERVQDRPGHRTIDRHGLRRAGASALLAGGLTHASLAEFQRFEDFEAWHSAAGAFSTIGFDDFPVATVITNQYADLGVHFSTDDAIGAFVVAGASYPQDGYGLRSLGVVALSFDEPIRTFATHFPGARSFRFSVGGTTIHETFQEFEGPGGDGIDVFRGYVASPDLAFDRIEIINPLNEFPGGPFAVTLDNIYFSTIPAPGALALFGLGALTVRRRRG